ncbi:MAG: TIGR03905 family TSCPD domain-containing protein [Eggerthellaceae bacterium]
MYTYYPERVCAKAIQFDLTDDGKVCNVAFQGGCDGNLKAISKVCEGQDVETLAAWFEGNDCRGRGTSCVDQLMKGIRKAQEAQRQN